jgi:ABC-type uncharacterized transport system involved in gliding motility auxiliary subunit
MELLKKYGEYLALGGLACLAAALVRFFIGGEFNVYVQGLVAAGLVLLVLYALGRPEEVRGALTGRRARYGSNVIVMTVAFVGILVLVNYLGTRYEKRLDWTQDKVFTISEQTRKVLANLDKPIKITGFYQQGDSRQEQVADLLKEYRQYTNYLTWEFIDPDVQPAAARQAGISDYGTLVFESEGRKQNTTSSDEQGLTSAILKVSSGEQKVVYFLTGHGERASDGYGQDGYSQAKQVMEQDNYVVKTITLAVTPTVPADCALLIIASPTKPLLDKEIAAVNDYLDKGGKLLYLTDPQVTTGLEEGVLKKFGIQVRSDIVVDPASSLLGDVASPLVSNFRWSPITKDLKAAAIFPQTRSLVADANPPTGVSLTAFAETSADSWGETDLTNRQVGFDAAKDTKGPVTVGLSAEIKHVSGDVTLAPTARVVVFGDSDFAANAFLGTLGNRDLFANSVNWLTEEESLISIRAKPPTDRMLYMTTSEQILGLVTSIVLLPLAVLLAGGVVWWRRR